MSDTIISYLESLGIRQPVEVIHNPDYEQLFDYEMMSDNQGFERGYLSDLGAVNVLTGEYTGRSPKDKYITCDDETRERLWWAGGPTKNDNKPITPNVWQRLKTLATNQLCGKTLYVVDGYCGANPKTRLAVRFIMEVAWQAHFVKNMFIRPSREELAHFKPDFTVINASKVRNDDYADMGLNSPTFVAFNLTEHMQIIGGTWYGGEMKKGLFSVMNYRLPQANIASMHCSANQGKAGDIALFFGLSGTGKTTLSADPGRDLIGDDEHGWDDEGVFNFEGGCYAKTIDLSLEKEPDIYRAIRRNALLENVVVKDTGAIDFSDGRYTQNTRVSYPIDHIDNIVRPVSRGGHASRIIFLTADGYGVLPPVSLLTDMQAEYHYLSGFTSKIAGTERGVTEPTPVFSACFGAAFLTLHPTYYARVLKQRMQASGARAYLVNTGWNGSGERNGLHETRTIIKAILSGALDEAPTDTLPIFNLAMPKAIDGVDSAFLDPRSSWPSEADWRVKAETLAGLFQKNFENFSDVPEGRVLVSAGPLIT